MVLADGTSRQACARHAALATCRPRARTAAAIELGILTGVAASLAVLVSKTTRPHLAVLGRLPGTNNYRNVKRFEEAQPDDHVLVLRLGAQIYFGNVNFLKETLDSLIGERPSLRAIVLDASGIDQIDASGDTAFREILDGCRARSVELLLANVKGPVRDVFDRSGLTAAVGGDQFFFSVHEAVVVASDLPVPSRGVRLVEKAS